VMKTPQEWARDCLERIDLAGAEVSASEVVAVIVAEAVAEENKRCCDQIQRVIDLCINDIQTGHIPSSFDPWTRLRECQLMLASIRGETT